jgi:hypothetical protein
MIERTVGINVNNIDSATEISIYDIYLYNLVIGGVVIDKYFNVPLKFLWVVPNLIRL